MIISGAHFTYTKKERALGIYYLLTLTEWLNSICADTYYTFSVNLVRCVYVMTSI